jgi:hypothetical protein
MRAGQRTFWATVAAAALLAPAATVHADYFDALQDVALGRDHTPPLVPLRFPHALGTPETFAAAAETSPHAYSLTFNRPYDLKRKIILSRGVLRSLAQLDRQRGQLDRVRRMRIRGHKGELRTGRYTKDVELAWTEGGRLFELSSSPRSFYKPKDLIAMAKSLDPIRGAFAGTGGADAGQSALAIVTAHTISFDIDWGASCIDPAINVPTSGAGSGLGQLIPLHGGAFSAANVPTGTDRPAWTSQISGTVSAATVQLSYHATGTVTGFACDTGPQSLTLTPAQPLP